METIKRKKDMEHGMEAGLHGLVQGLHASMVRGFKVTLLMCRFRSFTTGRYACMLKVGGEDQDPIATMWL